MDLWSTKGIRWQQLSSDKGFNVKYVLFPSNAFEFTSSQRINVKCTFNFRQRPLIHKYLIRLGFFAQSRRQINNRSVSRVVCPDIISHTTPRCISECDAYAKSKVVVQFLPLL